MIQVSQPHLQGSLLEFEKFVRELYGEYIEQLILFGSQARGDAREDSDVDILIVTQKRLSLGEREKLIAFVSDLAINENILINFIEMSPQRFSSEQSPLLLNIRREGIVL
jgi:predicted nucleotidyltransferase